MTIVSAEHQVGASANQLIAARSPTMVARTETAMPTEFLSFRPGCEEYGIDIVRVQEILGHEQPTRIAGALDCIKGVVNLRASACGSSSASTTAPTTARPSPPC
jgi:hypothetical protein